MPAGSLRSAELKPDIPVSLFPARPEKRDEVVQTREKSNISRPRSNDIPRIQVDRHQTAATVDIFDDDLESDGFLGSELYFF